MQNKRHNGKLSAGQATSYKLQTKNGFSIIEAVVMAGLISIILSVTISTLVSMLRVNRDLRAARDLNNAAVNSLERLTREIRGGSDIVIADSVLDTNPGRLSLSTTNVAGNPTTITFVLASTTLMVERPTGNSLGPLTPYGARVDNLIFRKFETAASKGIKVEINISSGTGSTTRNQTFYTSAVLRGSYE